MRTLRPNAPTAPSSPSPSQRAGSPPAAASRREPVEPRSSFAAGPAPTSRATPRAAAPFAPGELKAFLESRSSDAPFTAEEMARFRQVARERLSTYESHWSGPELNARFQTFVRGPTPKMETAANALLGAELGHAFSGASLAKLSDPDLRTALASFAFLRFATGRGFLADKSPTDWNGGPHREMPMPSKQVAIDLRRLATQAIADFDRALSSKRTEGLPQLERDLLPVVRNLLVSVQSGSTIGFGIGGDDAVSAVGIATFSSCMVVGATKAGGDVYDPEDDAFFIDLVTRVFGDLERVNAGTVQSVKNEVLPTQTGDEMLTALLGDPKTTPASRAVQQVNKAFVQRLEQDPRATALGYDDDDGVARMWRGFQADARVPKPLSMSLARFSATVDRAFDALTEGYREKAKLTIAAMFPDLSPTSLAKVTAAIDGAKSFGAFPSAIVDALPKEAGARLLAMLTERGPENLDRLGGPDDAKDPARARERVLTEVWRPVRDFYRHFAETTLGHIDPPKGFGSWQAFIEHVFDERFLNVDFDAPSSSNGGPDGQHPTTTVALGREHSVSELVMVVFHEQLHAIQNLTGQMKALGGVAIEGGPELNARLYGDALLDFVYRGQPAKAQAAKLREALNDQRFAAGVEATLVTLGAQTRERATEIIRRDIGPKWGLDAKRTEGVLERAFSGTQYLNYIGGLIVEEALMKEIAADVARVAKTPPGFTVSPLLLELIGLDTSIPSQAVAERIAQRLELPPR